MANSEKEKLIQEYVSNLKRTVVLPLKLYGIGRFDISSNNKIVQKGLVSIFLSMLILAVINFCSLYIVYVMAIQTNYLLISEVIILSDYLVFHNSVLFNMSFVNRGNAARFINHTIELDVFLGYRETLFMRNLTSKVYLMLCIIVTVIQAGIWAVLIITYEISDFYIYVTGVFLFFLLYAIYYDLSFFASLYTFLTLRVRYLNIAIMKLADMKLEYLPEQFPFNSYLWVKKFDKLVYFHTRAKMENFSQAFMMMFNQMRYLENSYRFTIFCCLTYLIVGTFVTVQSYIICIKSTNVDLIRIGAITGWCALSWIFQIGLAYQMDMLQRQLHQTSLICTFILLKPNYSDEVYSMAESVIRVLDMWDPRMSIYGLFYFDTGLLLRITSAVFVYITMQLQIAFPKSSDVVVINNITTSNV